MHHVIMQAHEGPRLQTLLEYLQLLGINRVVFPGREYRSERAGGERLNRPSVYETARLMPRGDDGGFADRFLRRNTRDT